MADSSSRRIRLVIDHLIEKDYLRIQGEEYPTLSLSPQFREITGGQTMLTIMLPQEPASPEAPPGYSAGPEGRADPAGTVLKAGEGDETLLARLRELRKDIARRARVPAYMVFPDASLQDMCRKRPDTPSRFLEVSGVGPAKLEKYGDAFIALIRKSAPKPAPQSSCFLE
jgi:ATP-dependent DNA helicase RecQ